MARRGRLRIIGGRWRSRILEVADVRGLRPTPDRVRETLFNWLGERVCGARCLDLFAGTGALGFEAASRGAARVVMVEHDRVLVRSLRAEVSRLNATDVEVAGCDALSWLRKEPVQRFDIALLDPPFDRDLLPSVTTLLESGGHLAAGALVYMESSRQTRPSTLPPGWQLEQAKVAGQVHYCLAHRLAGGVDLGNGD